MTPCLAKLGAALQVILSYIEHFSLLAGEENPVEEADGPVENQPEDVPGLLSRLLVRIFLYIYSV